MAGALPSFLNVLGIPFLSLSRFKAKPPRCGRLCASVTEFCAKAPSIQFTCVFRAASPYRTEAASWSFLLLTLHLAPYLVQNHTPTCVPYHWPPQPHNRLSQEAPMGHGLRPDIVVPLLSSPRPSFGPVCANDRGKWSQIDCIRIKAGKVFGLIFRRLSEERKPQILSFFKAEQQSRESRMERIMMWNLQDRVGCMRIRAAVMVIATFGKPLGCPEPKAIVTTRQWLSGEVHSNPPWSAFWTWFWQSLFKCWVCFSFYPLFLIDLGIVHSGLGHQIFFLETEPGVDVADSVSTGAW